MIDSKKLNWKDNKLYYGNRLMYSVVKDAQHESMFRIEYPGYLNTGPTLSEDFYNLSWAKENSIMMALEDLNGEGGEVNEYGEKQAQ